MKNRFRDDQAINVLKEHECSSPATDIVRVQGIAEQTLYNWKRKDGDMCVLEIKRLK